MSNHFPVSIHIRGTCSGGHQTGEIRSAEWGALLTYISPQGKKYVRRISGTIENENVTSNIAQLTAVLQGMQAIKPELRKDTMVTIYSDSKYVINTFTQWIRNWVVKDGGLYKKGGREMVANNEMILGVSTLGREFSSVNFEYVGDEGQAWKDLPEE